MANKDVSLAKGTILLGILSSLALTLQGCSTVQQPYLIVQMCLVDQLGVAHFKSLMRANAKLENFEYIDNSARKGVSLKTMGADKLLNRIPRL